MLDLSPPLDSCDPGIWAEYADWLLEQEPQSSESKANRAWVVSIYQTLLAFKSRQESMARLLLLREHREARRRPRPAGYVVFKPTVTPVSFVHAFKTKVWVNRAGASHFYGLDWDPESLRVFCPWDVPGFVLEAPDLVWAFFRRITADAKLHKWVP